MNKLTVVAASVVVTLLWVLWVLQFPIMKSLGIAWDPTKLGPWGDTFGALNALFAAVAFISVLSTLRMQSIDLANQQKEIERQKIQIERDNRDRQIQQFEGSLFQLLDLFRTLREQVRFPAHNTPLPTVGMEAIEAGYAELLRYLAPQAIYGTEADNVRDTLAGFYSDGVHRHAEERLGPYYRILYTMLRRISELGLLSDQEKARYGNLIRSQLSSAEVGLIAANGLTKASNNLFDYIVEFRLLKYLPKGAYRTALQKIYPPKTFEPRD